MSQSYENFDPTESTLKQKVLLFHFLERSLSDNKVRKGKRLSKQRCLKIEVQQIQALRTFKVLKEQSIKEWSDESSNQLDVINQSFIYDTSVEISD